MNKDIPQPSGETEHLRERISASRARSGTRKPTTTATGERPSPPDGRGLFEKTLEDHPLALLAGSMILGVVAANLFRASLGKRIASRLAGVAAVAGELGAAYGSKTLEAAAEAGRAGQERLARVGDAVAEESAEVRRRAAEMGAQARRRAAELAAEAAAEAREARETAVKQLGKLSGR